MAPVNSTIPTWLPQLPVLTRSINGHCISYAGMTSLLRGSTFCVNTTGFDARFVAYNFGTGSLTMTHATTIATAPRTVASHGRTMHTVVL
jgi:hypothetical protein